MEVRNSRSWTAKPISRWTRPAGNPPSGVWSDAIFRALRRVRAIGDCGLEIGDSRRESGMSNEPNLCETGSRRARPALRDGGRNAGRREHQTKPILRVFGRKTRVAMEDKANLAAFGAKNEGRDGKQSQLGGTGGRRARPALQGGRPNAGRPAIGNSRQRMHGAPNKANFCCFGPETRVACENKANLRARGLPLGIWDCGLGILGCGGMARQTKPICATRESAGRARPPGWPEKRRGPGMTNEPNLRSGRRHHGDTENTEICLNVISTRS